MSELTFVVPAYGESLFLRECLRSLSQQTVQSRVIIATSTPNNIIHTVANEFGFEVHVNKCGGSISRDWNFALSCADTNLVTLAHQDDIYHPEYANECLKLFSFNPSLAIVFSDSLELINNKIYANSKREVVKKILRYFSFLGRDVIGSESQYFRLLAFGCPIPCPSVMFNRTNIGSFDFSDDYSLNLDWDAWTRLAENKKKIGYVRRGLLIHRIHADAETQKGLADKRRDQEDFRIFCRFWPRGIARIFLSAYRFGNK